MTDFVHITEVGARDGLQNESRQLSVAQRIELIRRLSGCGFPSVEAGAFVSARRVAAMEGSAEVLAAFAGESRTRYPVLVPNLRGFAAAQSAGACDIAVFASASEAFSQHNLGCGIDDSLARYADVCARARDAGIAVRGYVSCIAGCPYQGAVAPRDVARVAAALSAMGCHEISLGDTIGCGTPQTILAAFDAAAMHIARRSLVGHFHDTRGMAIANIYAALEAGIRRFDASVAGLGGCPFAAGASGNVASEDLVYLLAGEGLDCGIDLPRLLDTVHFICAALGRQPDSRVARAMAVPGDRHE
ncbi:hydroxymethylglutaryl-CoA lyase [Paludibacterium yongneupense]|uniref:hydroxymethylglutaryl-CoA lyase n=1 Tax=Paludibacterium yongneupense TaxID=400061 RepID=UPI00041EB4A8|nr:hydroxymethylglutaryl-CoA lyase [Paludibacterium yongneupense]